MRQAGRSLPQYREVRKKYGLFDIVRRPELCAEVTLQPIDAYGVDLAPDWEERVYVAHTEGYAAVGGSIAYDGGRLRRATPHELEPYAPGGGRNPAFAHPLVCPSLLPPLEPNAEVHGLPAWRPEGDEPWLYDARIALTLRPPPRRRLRPPR